MEESAKISIIDIKSNFILKKVIDYLPRHKLLRLINHSKKVQNKLNKNINDYKNEFYKIIIEIIPLEYSKGKILYNAKKNKSHYHIYLNDDKIETKRKSITKAEKINKIILEIDYDIKSLKDLFRERIYIKKINFIKFNRDDVIDMSSMFYGCEFLEEINFSKIKTNNVTDMNSMFKDCKALKELDLSYFNTNNVTNMSSMFCGCKWLNKINLSGFNTSKVTNMSFMFSCCLRLKELNLSFFNTSNVTDMSYMFNYCSSLSSLDISAFNFDIVKYKTKIFSRSYNLKEIKYKDPKIIYNLHNL